MADLMYSWISYARRCPNDHGTFEFSIKYYMDDFVKSLSIFLVMYCSISSILLLLLGDQVIIACILLAAHAETDAERTIRQLIVTAPAIALNSR
jgi:hypothetical protein